ncbi:chitobiase/beta-hexosaminidase C-terminal domain-containing protein [Paenibacillus shenyangensis]|uniref:chitobiase/beta-hexosaminidase C-terminal domain-containing protein n=1 Tax=Paenibacillus sp. A9 TaxID=1284352 RepID=UPI000360DCB2|nr:chitobiase/beta-hexosaminidase C-terminal domain-containing protein [Paenibacillus sp. A9]
MNKKARSVFSIMGTSILLLSLILPSVSVPSKAKAAESTAAAAVTRTISIDPDKVMHSDFLGVGVNIIPTNTMDLGAKYGYNDAYWAMDVNRIQKIQPKVARVWFQIDWMEPKKGQYTFDSPKMKEFYRYLDALKGAGTEVELNFGWKVGQTVQDWFNFPDLKDPYVSAPTDLNAYAASASAALNELINKRGYDNVKYMTFYNESNGSWDFEGPADQKAYFAEMTRKVSDRLQADGLRDQIEIWGPEESGALDWISYMKQNADSVFDAYTFHVYGTSYDGLKSVIDQRTTIAGNKPVVMTEFGWSADDASGWDAGFANSIIRAANDGLKGALMWQMNGAWTSDPDGDTNGTYTMWSSLPLDRMPRKTYYSAGFLNRYIPEHSDVLAVDTGGADDVRAAAFKGKDGNYTVLVESKGGEARNLNINFGDNTIGKTFYKMTYRDNMKVDANAILPQVEKAFAATRSFTDNDSDTAYHFSIYTTAKPQTQVEVTPIEKTITGASTLQMQARVIDATYTGQTVVTEDTYAAEERDAMNADASTTRSTDKEAAKSIDSAEDFNIVNTGSDSNTQDDSAAVQVAPATVETAESENTVSEDTYDATDDEEQSLAAANGVTWTVLGTNNGTIDANGLYRAPDIASERLVAIKASSGQGVGAYGIALIKVIPRSVPTRVEAPTFSLKPGIYDSAEAVFIETKTPGAQIYYTMDGSTPTASSRLYKHGAILPNGGNRMLKAIAIKPGLDNSGITAALYKTKDVVIGPDNYEFCMYEGKVCDFTGKAMVAYGADGMFKYKAFTDGVECTDESFGADPAPGIDKRCFFTNDVPDETPVVTIYNAGFEKPGTATTRTGPFTNGWIFDSRSGVSTNGSQLVSKDIKAPQGLQVGYLKTDGGVNGTISQQLNFPGGTYELSFDLATRSGYGIQTFDVYVDNQKVSSFTADSVNFQKVTSAPFTVTAGKHNVKFIATSADPALPKLDRTAFLDSLFIRPANSLPAQLKNGGFETPVIPVDSKAKTKPGPFTSDWVFDSRSGVQGNNSVLGNVTIPEGAQSAYLKTDNGINGTITQKLKFPEGSYTLSFKAAQRTNLRGTQKFNVMLDNQVLGSYTPASGAYEAFTINAFPVTAGEHTLKFVATSTTGDNTAFIDDVKLTSVQ